MLENKPLNRRDFLKNSAMLGAGISIPFFFDHLALAKNAIQNPKTPIDDRILVILQLDGGNDGLNTVVPYGVDDYYKLRKNLAIKKKNLHKISGNELLGLNNNLTGLMRLYDDGKLAIINGVGYPNPNRSHFRSMEIWQTASDSNKFERNGWVGKYHDMHPDSNPDPLSGIAINSKYPQSFWGDRGLSVSFTQPYRFRWQQGLQGDTHEMFRKINKVSKSVITDRSSSINYLRHVTSNIVKSSDKIQKANRTKVSHVEYPQNALGRNLRNVSKLIKGGLPTNVYQVAFGGFDTHANQANQHRNLMTGFSTAVDAFMKDMKKQGLEDRVLVLCFSEFGRRPAENASGGTDHGTAGPMFIIGNGVRPGLHGQYPSLTDLDDNKDLKFNVDFRSVYSEVLNSWFDVDAREVLGKSFAKIDLINPLA